MRIRTEAPAGPPGQVSFRRVGPEAPDRPPSSALPQDLFRQVRARVRLLALLILAAFGFDLLIAAGKVAASAAGYPVPPDAAGDGPQSIASAGAVAMSAGLWWAARSPRVPASRLHTIGLAYEVAICFVIAMLTNWQYYTEHGLLPNLTWVPGVVILFPLILPGPPRRMLAAAVAAGATAPAALLALDRLGAIQADGDAYLQATFASGFAVLFANLGARIVHGLGREVVLAREMGNYQLEARLGQGGMGEVWRARHRLLARPAAVKLVRPPRAPGDWPVVDEVAPLRFEREAQATAGLRSPHTVELFDFGVAADGTFYYVMELLDGVDADTLVRRFGPVPAARAIHLLRQACHSLSEAESRGLVHRDVKPANLMVCRYGEDLDFVKVLDFGLVKALATDLWASETMAAVSRDGMMTGTPAFMAPEQAMGGDEVDGRADIYALGGVACWLL
ncbi:MAG: serine/threonine-protein kinase, partial [Vicinamibacterales bacterium]